MLERAVPTIASPLSSVSFDPVNSALAVLFDLFSEVFPPLFVVEGAIQASVLLFVILTWGKVVPFRVRDLHGRHAVSRAHFLGQLPLSLNFSPDVFLKAT
jgi:hypothetical protein